MLLLQNFRGDVLLDEIDLADMGVTNEWLATISSPVSALGTCILITNWSMKVSGYTAFDHLSILYSTVQV
jgi:hypothetical protein